MRVLAATLEWLRSWFECREVTDLKGEVYLRRWRILRFRGRSIVVHQLLRSDYAPDPHNHPWPFVTVILSGGYWESVDEGPYEWRRPGRLLYRRSDQSHRIEIPSNGHSAWTLMIRGKKRGRWGFQTRCGWQFWKEYVEKAKRGLPICEDETFKPGGGDCEGKKVKVGVTKSWVTK